MGLLENMRAGTDSTFMQVVLGLVVVSFVFWYAAPQGDKSKVVATVNGQEIMDTVQTREYRQLARRVGRALSEEEEASLRDQSLQQVIQDEILFQEAERLGIEVSVSEVARLVLATPYFLNEEGEFDDRIYSSYLRNQGWTSADYEEDLRRDLVRDKLKRLVFFGATISEPVVREHFVHTNTRVDIEYVRVRPDLFTDDVTITDEELATWMAENPELIEAEYKADFERSYDLPEKVELSVIRLGISQDGLGAADLLPRIKDLKAQLDGGADFAELARRWSEHPSAAQGGSLGQQAVPQLDTDLQEYLAALEPGQAGPARSMDDGDFYIYRLDAREEARVIPQEEVQEDIARALIREQRAPTLAAEYADRLLAEWTATQATPNAILAEQGLRTMTTGPVVAAPDNSAYSPPLTMLEMAMSSPVGQPLPDVFERGGVLWVGALRDRIEPDMSLYETERDLIQEETLMSRRAELYDAWVTDMRARAKIKY